MFITGTDTDTEEYQTPTLPPISTVKLNLETFHEGGKNNMQ
jgi:hypothetical protein